MVADYITDSELRSYMKDPDSGGNADTFQAAIKAASRKIDAFCGRYFYQQIETQYYFPRDWWTVDLGDMDIATTSGLAVSIDSAGDGSYATALTLNTHYILEPINQSSNGITPWPYEYIRAIQPQTVFPIRYTPWQRPTVKVVATFGWPTAVPDVVKQATRIIAAQLWKLGDAPLGTAGVSGWGEVRVKDIPLAAGMLRDYSRSATIGIA